MLEMALKWTWELLRNRKQAEVAKISAYWLAPGLILLFTISGPFGGGFAIDGGRPIALSELRSEISSNGMTARKAGFALIIEPVPSEFRFEVGSIPSHVWSSLDEPSARANKDRLTLDGSGVRSRAPFLGVAGPVMVVVEGQISPEIRIPGGTEKMEDLVIRSKRSVSVVTSVLLVCVFAFGMSAGVLPPVRRKKHAGS
jgi:hypothetical protein